MKTEIERAKESIKEYRKGYGQSQLPTDCIIQLMIGHAKSEQLLIQRVSNCGGAIPYDSLSDSFKKSIDSIEDNLNK
jgi:hypothetical protein